MFKVMIVDDMEILRLDVKRLKLWGAKSGFYICDEAKDGLDALKKLEAGSFDLVITDIRMPNMDGLELLQNIYKKKLCPCAVLLSDYTEYNYARQGFVYGAFDYIGKPVDERELSKLLERVRQHLAEKRHEEQKLKELQGMIEETIFTAADVKQIIGLINYGDKKAVVLVAAMVDMIGASFNYDMTKALVVLKNAMNEIICESLKSHAWIAWFIDADALKRIDLSTCKDWEAIRTVTVETAEKLITVVDRFMGRHDNSTVKQVCKYVLENTYEEISVKTLSEKFFISKSYLSDMFRQKLGLSLLEYITMIKMERSKRLFHEGNLKSYEIANKLGFKDNEYFSRLFKKHTGMSPTEFRQQMIIF